MDMNLNKWSAWETELCSWIITFQPVEDIQTAKNLIPFMKELLRFGEEYQVLKVISNKLSRRFPDLPERSYFEQLEYLLHNNQWFDFLHNVETCSKIAYFDVNGNIVKDDIADLLSFIEKLEPAKLDHGNARYAPLEMSALGTYLDTGFPKNYVAILFYLHTDMWFPSIIDWDAHAIAIDDKPEEAYLVDNRALALDHTPRLNAFLERARKLTYDYGGEWEMERFSGSSPIFDLYKNQLTITGIRLE